MSAAGLLATPRALDGLHPMRLRRDLGGIADLVEVCFSSTLDSAGRSAIHEMRVLSRSGPLLWLAGQVSRTIPVMQGFVWLDTGRVVGNVSLSPAPYGQGWVIANVAVYPEYRRRGIARQLMVAALESVAQRGKFAILQVDADNPPAIRLYESLGFRVQRTFVRWRRPAYLRAPDPQPDWRLRHATRRDAGALYTLAQQVRPNALGGMGWLRPTRPEVFRAPRLDGIGFVLSGQRTGFLIVPGPAGCLEGAVRTEQRLGGLTVLFDLLVHSQCQGTLEASLVSALLNSSEGRHQPYVTEHPADDEITTRVLEDHFFRPERTLVHMIRPVHSQELHE